MQQGKFFISFIMVMFLFLTGCSTGGKAQPFSETYAKEQIRVYEVFGMDCPGCHSGIEKLVKEVPKVVDAKANWSEKKITIVIKKGSSVEDKAIFKAIERANFTPGKRVQ